MRIVVTEKDIAAGVRCSAESCPIALAIKRALPNRYVSVSGDEIAVGKKNYVTPRAAVHFIVEFDAELPVCPIAFDLVELELESI